MAIKFTEPIEVLCEFPKTLRPSSRLFRLNLWKAFPQRARTHLKGERIDTLGQLVYVEYTPDMSDPSLINRLCLIPGIDRGTANNIVKVLKEAGFKGRFFEGRYRAGWVRWRKRKYGRRV